MVLQHLKTQTFLKWYLEVLSTRSNPLAKKKKKKKPQCSVLLVDLINSKFTQIWIFWFHDNFILAQEMCAFAEVVMSPHIPERWHCHHVYFSAIFSILIHQGFELWNYIICTIFIWFYRKRMTRMKSFTHTHTHTPKKKKKKALLLNFFFIALQPDRWLDTTKLRLRLST